MSRCWADYWQLEAFDSYLRKSVCVEKRDGYFKWERLILLGWKINIKVGFAQYFQNEWYLTVQWCFKVGSDWQSEWNCSYGPNSNAWLTNALFWSEITRGVTWGNMKVSFANWRLEGTTDYLQVNCWRETWLHSLKSWRFLKAQWFDNEEKLLRVFA